MTKHRKCSWFVDAPLVIAHRGASLQAPENTLAAFRLAVVFKADAIEMDAKLTADKHVVLHHDVLLDRTTDGKGRVSSQGLNEIKRLDAGKKFDISYTSERIPTLEETIEVVGNRALLNIELTNYSSPFDKLPEVVIDIIQRFGIQSRVLLSSFNPIALFRVRKIEPEIMCGLLIKSSEPKWLRKLLQLIVSHDAIHPSYDLLNKEFINQYARSEKPIYSWTVNNTEEIMELLDLGVNGIITDDPKLVRDIIGENE